MTQQQKNSSQKGGEQPWSPSSLSEQILGIEELMKSSCWLVLSPLKKQNWRRQLNGLRCRYIFQSAYPDPSVENSSSHDYF